MKEKGMKTYKTESIYEYGEQAIAVSQQEIALQLPVNRRCNIPQP
jgi:hypothetical protein